MSGEKGIEEYVPDKKRSDRPQRDRLIELGVAAGELWHDGEGIAYVSVTVDGHLESFLIRSGRFRKFLGLNFFESNGTATTGQALEDAIRVLEAQAESQGPRREAFVRVGRAGDVVFLDLGDPSWRVVEVSAAGWDIVDRPADGVRFVRPHGLLPLPEPARDGSLEELRPFVTVDDAEFKLLCGWAVGALRGVGPYCILILGGEQGSGKSFISRMLRELFDPNTAALRRPPRETRDLVVAARHSHILALDNVSGLPEWLSDDLCALAFGGGFSGRQLHTDSDEILFAGARPLIINGLGSPARRADLGDRAVSLFLPTIDEADRRGEAELFGQFQERVPYILGALLDAVAAALKNWDKTVLERSPRMADFARWVQAAEAGAALPWECGAFEVAYGDNRGDLHRVVVENDPVAKAVVDLIGGTEFYEGSMTGLYDALIDVAPSRVAESRLWPQSPGALSMRLRRVAPALRAVGVELDVGRVGKARQRIVRLARSSAYDGRTMADDGGR